MQSQDIIHLNPGKKVDGAYKKLEIPVSVGGTAEDEGNMNNIFQNS